MPPTTKPKLGKLATPVTSTFPLDVHSVSGLTPRSAVLFSYGSKPDSALLKTPISPPLAYTDFLTRAVSLNSPALAPGEGISSPIPTSASVAGTRAGVSARVIASASASASAIPSAIPSDDASENSDNPSTDGSSSPASSTSSSKTLSPLSVNIAPPSPQTAPLPMSAPPTGAHCFPSLKLPPSPALSYLDSPMSARLLNSPFSARSIHSPFDWELALKARLAEQKKQKTSRTGVRHIREVVTRTVTYTPKIEAAPRGKRRKIE